MAAGLELEQVHFEAFRDAFNRVTTEALSKADLRQVQAIDAWVDLDQANTWLFESIMRIRPFGHSNPTPVWASRGLEIIGEPRVVGTNHLRFSLSGNGVRMDAIGFGLAKHPVPAGRIDVAYQLRMNTYQGRSALQLNVQDFRASEPQG